MATDIKQAVILCAGLGTRLRPVTDTVPKVMIPILGKPLLLRHIEQFKKHDVTEFFINTHYLPNVITDYFGDGSAFGVKIVYSFEKEPLGTAGGVKGFEKKLDDAFFLIYGDVFSLVDYSKMRKVWEKLPSDTLGMQRMRGTHMRGIFILRKKVLSFISSHAPYEISGHLLPDIASRGLPFYSYECDDFSKGIDTVEKWREVEAYLRTLLYI